MSKVQIVDTVEVHVLSVPCKGGFPHAKIQIWGIDPLDDDATLLLHHIQQSVEVANIPLLDVLKYVIDMNKNPLNVLVLLHYSFFFFCIRLVKMLPSTDEIFLMKA